MFTLHVYDLIFASGGGGDVSVVSREKAAQASDCRHIYGYKYLIFLVRTQDTSSRVCGDQNRFFKTKHDVFLALTKSFF